MTKLHVLMRKEDLASDQAEGKVVVVLDILFATTTIVAALAGGARRVFPVRSADEARALAVGRDPEQTVLAGELNARNLIGFRPAAPLALARHGMHERDLIYSTTNGTVAIRLAEHAAHVYAAALINGRAVMEHVLREHPAQTVVILCSGSGGAFNLEDFYGAGRMIHLAVAGAGATVQLTDAAQAALNHYDGAKAYEYLAASRVGRMMAAANAMAEVEYAAGFDRYDIVPKLRDGAVIGLH